MTEQTKGPAFVIGPEEGDSYWQPEPSTGYSTVKLSPFNSPYNDLSIGIQVLAPGARVREHAHQRADEMLFVYAGTGTAVVDGETHAIEPGSLVMVGRYVRHEIVNEGDDEMRILWMITPPGLESWFEAIGQPRTPGESPPAPFPRPDGVADIQRMMYFAPRPER